MSALGAEPIAVTGVGCRFPGGVETPEGLWQLAADGRQTVGPVPADRWDAQKLALLHDPELRERAAVGCFLDGDVWAWEPEALSVAPAEREWVDPQARVLMETAREAVEHAGLPVDQLRATRTGVYVGTYALDNLFREARPVEDAPNSPYLFGNYHAGPAGRVAFAMDLRGPVMVVGTHCSAGLVALDTACGALALGQCDAALAGGVLLMLAPQTHYFEAPLLLSRRGACHAFDARGDGYVRGEGAGMILLKRLTDAQRDGDRVLAVIRGSAVNNDGQATRLTAPSTEMQQELFREAVRRAGIDPGEVGLVEAHGPGTAVGDPIEYTSINAVYGKGRGRCALGSVKTNIGHCEPVSGIAGLIKTVECLRRGVIPPNQNFRSWNPGIDRDAGSRLFVPTELTEWPVDGVPRRAAVCSYGVSGTNAHVVLEQAPAPRRRRARKAARHAADGPRLFLLSADSAGALADSARRLAAWLEGPGAQADLGDVAHTLAMRRRHAEHRLGIVAADTVQLRARARAFAGEDETDGVASGVPLLAPGHPGPVFVFTGQGSQYPGMCRELLASEPAFAAAVDELEALIFAESGFSLRSMIEEPEGPVGVDRIQPALFGVQVALAELWRSWGLEPAAVIGQSLGEVAASVVAGVLSREDGAKVICRRAALLARIAHGAMASVLLSAEETRAALESAGADGVDLGVLTAPRTTVISGDAAQVRALVEHWNETGTVARMVDVNVASHSSQVDPVIDDLHAVLSELPDALPGDIRFYSTVSEDPRGPGPLNASYWVRNQRDTVHFQRAVTAALADGHRLFVECTAHPLAARPIHEIARQTGVDDVVTVGSLRRGAADQEAFLTHLATAHAAGCGALDLASRYGDGQLVDLPTTAWNRTRHGGTAAPYTLVAPHFPAAGQHPLLGGHVHDPDRPGRHLWQTPLGPRRLPWLADHKVAGLPVLPGTGFAEMILAAAEVLDAGPVLLTGLRIEAPLVLDPEPEVTTHLTVDGDQWRAEVLTRTADGTVIHAHAAVQALATSAPAPCPDAVHRPTGDWRDTAPAALYRHFRERHDVHHGPAFAAIDRIRLRPERGGALSAVRIADSARVSAAAMRLHPALADEFVQTAVAAWLDTCATSPGPVVVAGFDEIRIYGPTGHARHASVTLHHADDLTCTASGTLATDDGTVVAELRGLRLTNITPPEQRYTDRLAHLTWTPAPPPTLERTTAQQWLVVAPQDTLWSERLHLMLSKHAAGSHLLSWPCGRPLDPEQLTKTLDDDSRPSPSHVLLALNGEDTQAAADGGRAAVLRVLTVLRTLAARPTPPRLWVLCRADQPLAAAGVRGLLRTAAFEHPELKPSSLELSGSTALEAVLPDLLKEPTPVTEISWHHGARGLTQVRRGPGPRHPASPPSPLVRPDGGYLITGGLGGLGLLTARRFAERGACRLVLAGRSAPGPEAERALEELRTATGAAVEVVLGDIAEEDTVRRALAAARANGAMLRGIIHAAGVVEDATLTNLDTALLDRVWRGKAEGAWALHRATLGAELDHFVLYSSIASLIGSPGQGAYAAANAFLDALVTHRLALGLPATGIHWGAWSQVGRGQHLVDRGFVMINPGDGTDAFERILTEGHHQIAYSPIDAAVWTAPYPALRHSTLLAELLTDAPAAVDDTSPVRDAVLTTDNAAERHQLLQDFVIDQVRELLGNTARHIGAHTSLVVLGLDSLGAVQLQQRLQNALHIKIKPGVIWVNPSAAALADALLEAMKLPPTPHDHTPAHDDLTVEGR